LLARSVGQPLDDGKEKVDDAGGWMRCWDKQRRPMLQTIKSSLRETWAAEAYHFAKVHLRPQSQSDEADILDRLAEEASAPHTFVEFGFGPSQFNCIRLCKTWNGLLIDGSEARVRMGRHILPRHIEIVRRFLTLDNLEVIRARFPRIGVLSIDVDGNDYWFLEALIDLSPSIIVVEYNSNFLLEPVTVPYDPQFKRFQAHPSGGYHGASLMALVKLCAAHGYRLAAVSSDGINAFFTRSGTLDPREAWRSNLVTRKCSGSTDAEQWERLKHLPFVSV
jgi:hypothetical protein